MRLGKAGLHLQLTITSLWHGNGGLVEALSTLCTVDHPCEVHTTTAGALPTSEREEAKRLVADWTFLTLFEHLSPTVWARLLFESTTEGGKYY